MRCNRILRVAGAGLLLAAQGCTTLREVPRGEYALQGERNRVRVETREGLKYEFDFARFTPDSMTGFRRLDVEGPADSYAQVSLDYTDLAKLSIRRVDWYKTGLIGGGVLAAAVAAGLSTVGRDSGAPDNSGGGKSPGIP
jgi:hypothetical protein